MNHFVYLLIISLFIQPYNDHFLNHLNILKMNQLTLHSFIHSLHSFDSQSMNHLPNPFYE